MPRLDGLRCFAVLAVLPVHFVKGWTAHWYAESGGLGVKLFFVLSGYLIAANLLGYRDRIDSGIATRGRALVVFYVRRMLRLSPVYYAYLAFACLMMPGIRRYLPWFFLYCQNFLFAARPAVFEKYLAHFWTLAIEEQFYLVAPILLLTAPRRWILWLSCGFVGCAPLFRAAGLALGLSEFSIHLMMPAQMDALGSGVLLAVVRWRGGGGARESPPLPSGRTDRVGAPDSVEPPAVQIDARRGDVAHLLVRLGWWFGLPLWVACRAAGTIESLRPFAFVLENLGLALALTAVIAGASRPSSGSRWAFLEYAPLVYIGRISYGIYVYHYNVPGLLRDVLFPRIGRSLPDSAATQFFLFTGATIVVASLSYYVYERPFMNLKRHASLGPARPARSRTVQATSST